MSVRQSVANYENKENYNDWVGWMSGLNEINQKKHYVSINALYYERHAKKGIRNHGHMKASLILYHVKQEPDFEDWYKEHNTTCHFVGY